MNQTPHVGWPPRLAVIGCSGALYLIACATPALTFSGRGTENWFGINALLIGWLSPFLGRIAWCANLLLPIAWLLMFVRRSVGAAVVAALAALIAADTFRLYGQEVPADEGGVVKLHFEHPHVGFYFWVASMLVVVVGALALLAVERSSARS